MNSNSQPWILTEVHQRHDEFVAAARNESLAREFVQAKALRDSRAGSSTTGSSNNKSSTNRAVRVGWLRRLLGLRPRRKAKPATPATGTTRPTMNRPRDARLVGR